MGIVDVLATSLEMVSHMASICARDIYLGR